MTIEYFIILICIFYLLQLLTYSIGIYLSCREKPNHKEPSVSVIIAARNEEQYLGNCLLSLSKVDYPKEKLEVIVINDHSTDNTKHIIENCSKYFQNFKTITPEKRNWHLIGKTNAIAQGIEITSGEIIITSDADCVFKTSWVKDLVKYHDDKTGIVSGFTYVETNSQFDGMQSLDWIYLLAVASGSFGIGIPLACVGNNMSFSKKAYDEVGGYENLRFSVTEDFALLQGIAKTKRWKCKYPVDAGNLILSKPCTTLKELFYQRKRWGRGGKKAPFIGLVLMAAGFLISGLVLCVPFLPVGIGYKIFLIFFKCMLDFIFLLYPLKKFNLLYLYKYLFVFEIYYTVYVFLLPFLVVFTPKVKWKGRVYK
jgi:cellulose synthase/poly-beta-1,6-N-acetylglucosamine synthase-like glycosyltransferase